ncbi:oxidoreductase [Alloyangia pacifica]|uniref:Oxidoreductase n=1 Tax=Alloyangia pacifica TaxID=311180 RepID=A0A2U8HIA7_9RHOB|nr:MULTISPECIES: SDR family NAD(P)-dependent oxidoreductase [Roseobacteraceae]AWI85502.1 oxidoreductase [Alloyangia pacifica]NDV51449.1 SDR family oxidoreductase [Salipiger sp. PrR003]NDW33471.1 SDR family oxidoreductase [Salipiger sp. PrR007]
MLKDRVALVTAAGSGIGRAGAVAMAREGAYVVVTDLREDLAAETLAEIDAAGGRGMAQGLDVRDDAAVEGLIERVAKDHGRLDVLHSHAGIQIEGKVEEVTPAQMDAAWALNVRAHFVASRAVIPHMRAQGGGSVIITASNSGCQYDRGMVSYATTKHAAVAMVKQMAVDYARERIRFNALCPGFVDTPFNLGFEKQMGGRAALESYVADTIPMGRWASTEEIAEGILYLASDRSAFVTGLALVIDGGEIL